MTVSCQEEAYDDNERNCIPLHFEDWTPPGGAAIIKLDNCSAERGRGTMRMLLVGMFCLLGVVAIIAVAVIAFSAPRPPPAVASMATISKQIKPDFPAPRQFQARDGASLQYYAYPAEPDKVAVLVNGSAFPGTSMHALAESLRAAGVTTYVPDIRGHGGSGRRGDIDYIGQIEDDLVDFVTQHGPVKSGETRALVGFSAGAGFTIRFAGGPYGLLFDRYVSLSPILPGVANLAPERRRLDPHFPSAYNYDRFARSPGHSLVRRISRYPPRCRDG
jgi:hypothetical protein